MVSPALVEELRIIIKEEYQMDLESEEASEVANTLVNFFNLLTKIESEDDHNQTKGDTLEL